MKQDENGQEFAGPNEKANVGEHCVCAAIRLADGSVHVGKRHGNCLKLIAAKDLDRHGHVQGFMTSLGRFVTREEGRELQDAAGLASADPEGYRGRTLFSEDLY